jgi:hypothetical protein
MGPIGSSERTVKNRHNALRNIPEEEEDLTTNKEHYF